MVRKLIRYDFASFLRLLLPVQLVLIGIAALSRLVQIFEDTKSAVYNIVFTSSVVLYSIAIGAALLVTVIVSLVRFYQGMYTNEGYLSHTLPVTPTQHIFSKLIVSMMFEIGTVLAIFISFCVITLGDVNIELFKAGFYLLGRFFELFRVNGALYIVEFILMLLASAAASMLKLYFCISIGQFASKKKILLAVGVYFGLYFISQIVGTVFVIFVTVNPELMENLYEWVMDNIIVFYHLIMCAGILVSAFMSAVYFLISRWIMSRKLNLT